MGGKISSPKVRSAEKGPGAVIFENNYALKEEFYEPVYVMGYVNNFAVEQYEGNDPEEGLPCETYDEDEVFSNCRTNQFPENEIPSPVNSEKYLLWDGKLLNISTGQIVGTYKGRPDNSIVLMNQVCDSNQYHELHNKAPIQDMDKLHQNVIVHDSPAIFVQKPLDEDKIELDQIEKDLKESYTSFESDGKSSADEKHNSENNEKDSI